jgi:hypothetical protein
MDNYKSTHDAIAKKFHLSNKTKRNLPWCSGYRHSRYDLAPLFATLNFNIGAEIGVRRGRFSKILCQDNPKLKMFCIDPWTAIDTKYPQARQDQLYETAVQVLEPFDVTIIRKTSLDALADIADRTLDFIFIDGDHRFDAVMMDIILWADKVKRGGIISCHDVYGGEVGVQKAVEAYVHSHNIVPWYITKELQPTAYWVNP